jgi:hypothetical protein
MIEGEVKLTVESMPPSGRIELCRSERPHPDIEPGVTQSNLDYLVCIRSMTAWRRPNTSFSCARPMQAKRFTSSNSSMRASSMGGADEDYVIGFSRHGGVRAQLRER